MFILMGVIKYEGDSFLGMFTSLEKANAAYLMIEKTKKYYDWFEILECTPDEPYHESEPETVFSSEP
ncbi:hypothetical protein HYP99_gp005 [Sinorhizobium phage ort11]|uniref:Uncharacterized protein n=1 Tax=Sinorhizobium phage ort11 TaxID=2599764 RepID=A0A5C2H6A5_9CAUD|nr:hypothetical protein HYP99_gp005 [Sinorhizobium phage ort11]QEP29803.1 hypothetical protein Smphiort11_005 [Sinorhizobium phage ort11]